MILKRRTTCLNSLKNLSIIGHVLFLASAINTQAATLRVPENYSTIQSAVSASSDGDRIEIQAGTYTGSGIVATIGTDNLTITGVNGMAHLDATGVTISNQKAIFVTTGNTITLENIEFSNAAVPDENGAGIRHEGGLLTIRNCSFHDSENGILTSSQDNAELYIENSEFNHNGLGRAGYTHNIYVGHIDKFTIKYSYSHHATHGHNMKSRAYENHILYNRIMDETSGNASYQIDVPDGGRTYIIGNTIHQGQNAENSSVISYRRENNSPNPIQELYVSGNTFVNDRASGSIGINLGGTPTAVIANNIFDNVTTLVTGASATTTGNIDSDSNAFVNRSGFDFRLTETSPARNSAVDPGSAQGVSLVPLYEYVHSMSSKTRTDDGSLDVGAFEFSDGTVPLTADFTTTPSTVSGVAPLTVQFHDASEGTPESWAWDFDNNDVVDSTLQSPQYIYDTPGTYTVSLRVTNTTGNDEEIKTNIITVTSTDGNDDSDTTPDSNNNGGGGGGCFIAEAGKRTE